MSKESDNKPSHDLQRVMLLVMLFVIHNDSLAGMSQNEFAKHIGCSKAQVSSAVHRLIDALRHAGVKVDSIGGGVESLICHLHAESAKLATEMSEEFFGVDNRPSLEGIFVPKVGWERFMKRILPDIWHLEWVQDLWDVRKLEAWLRGRAGSEVETIKAALTVIDIDIQNFRPYMSMIARGWEHLPSDLSEALPTSIKRSLGFKSVIPTRRVGDDERLVLPRPEWLEYGPDDLCRVDTVVRAVIKVFAANDTPMLRLFAGGEGWYVKRLRKFKGEWLLDCWNDEGEVRAWRIAEIGECATIEHAVPLTQSPMIGEEYDELGDLFAIRVPVWIDHEVPSQRVDHSGCMHLGQPRPEVFLLDYGEIKLPALRTYFVGQEVWPKASDSNQDPDARPADLPEGWNTRRIFPRYNQQSTSDPAWVEFVTILLQFAGRIRLRTPGYPEIESDPMLAFCSGPIDSRLLRESHVGAERVEGGERE